MQRLSGRVLDLRPRGRSKKQKLDFQDQLSLTAAMIHLQFWAYGSWDSLFPISMSPNCKLMSPKHYF